MRIDLNSRTPEARENDKPVRSSSSSSAAAPSRVETGQDETRLSQDQVRIQALEAGINRVLDIRKDKVEALQRTVNNGTYSVSSEQIAEALFSEMVARSSTVR